MKKLEVRALGPIQHGGVELGDLTVLVGPQASGKSLLVQLLKAILDAGAIRRDLRDYGFDWLHGEDIVQDYCSLYFGGGLEGVIGEETRIYRDGKAISFKKIANPPGRADSSEKVFLIPAQRVLVLQDGWPKPFMGYSVGDPYSIRKFSDSLRMLMEQGFGRGEAIFPQSGRLKAELRFVVDAGIYVGARLELETEGMRRRVVLRPPNASSALPYNAWSAGQREFTPLLLGLYWLMPSAAIARRGKIDTVIIEEPEMGLHPQAIVGFGLLVLELLARDYRVIVSTHSPIILDLVWAIRELSSQRARPAVAALCRVFDLKRPSLQLKQVLASALKKQYRTYYFHRSDGRVTTEDISSLNPGDESESVAGWGGLSGFSGRIAQIVGETLSP